MAKKFITTLGAGDYKDCYYVINGDVHYTNFIQQALVKQYCSKWSEQDSIVVILTDFARTTNWYNETDEKKRLKTNLENLNLPLKITECSIPDGKNEEEIWKTFETIYNMIEEDDEIIFDLTHSFRSIPMYMLVILNYAQVMKNIKISGIYYGAYESREKRADEETEYAPVFDLTSFNELLNWTQAINVFTKYGISDPLRDLYNNIKKEKNLKKDRSYNGMESFIVALNTFTNNIQIGNGNSKVKEDVKKPEQQSIALSAISFKEKYDEVMKGSGIYIKPLNPLIERIGEMVQPFETTDNLKVGLATIQWSINNNMIQQGYTALNETIKTYVCQKYQLKDCERKDREEIATKALNIKAKKTEEKNWGGYVKQEYKENVKKIVEVMDFEVAQLFDSISQKRNSINHFGFSDQKHTYEKLKRDLIEYFNSFKSYVEASGLLSDNVEE